MSAHIQEYLTVEDNIQQEHPASQRHLTPVDDNIQQQQPAYRRSQWTQTLVQQLATSLREKLREARSTRNKTLVFKKASCFLLIFS